MMKVLITGANGQLGKELAETRPSSIEIAVAGKEQLDIGDEAAVQTFIAAVKPTLVINAAAYTAVDKAESDSESAFRINETGVANLAMACKSSAARLLHVSTDFVFDGGQGVPYAPDADTQPLGVYGASKLAGEKALQSIAPEFTIIRTAWVYSKHNANFMKTMLRLMRERDQLGVICDQIGTPTSARRLAQLLWQIAARPDINGIHHWTDAGVASWYDFAVAIQEEALAVGLLDKAVPVNPIRSDQYPLPAKRPAFSVLDKTSLWQALGSSGVHWRVALREVLAQMQAQA